MLPATLIDEVGYLSYSNRHADLRFELISRRYGARSTIVTTNKPFPEWSEVFPNAACIVALVDRLVHRAEVISIEGESYRLKEARERTEARARQRSAKKSYPEDRSCLMSHKPLLPSGRRRGLPFIVPDDWTPDQAFAVFELLDDLVTVITDFYGDRLHELLRERRRPAVATRATDCGPPF
ncbi:hypothetical protein LMG29542_08433 [Paraburkholderia humisilvae]|uniref:IstB-like ATP-binding domain-containing protein n=1 Tax=Paraburkholderia humisilvae TaxID=627669 RepID=A0A6J5FB71_9BURK|nr:hypothetical protein LMG29542_08433 [Paraburkholderia humisilvae]